MRIEDAELVSSLIGRRERILALMKEVSDPDVRDSVGLRVWELTDGIVSSEFVIGGVTEGCFDALETVDKELVQLGVRLKPYQRSPDTVTSLRQTLDMYVGAWKRELGGQLINKAHLIDALVLTTRELRRIAESSVVDEAKAETIALAIVNATLLEPISWDSPQLADSRREMALLQARAVIAALNRPGV